MSDLRIYPSAFCVQEHFDDALSMMRALGPLDSRWRGGPGVWVFRGQSNSAWPMLPSAYRPGALLDGWRENGTGVRKTKHEQRAAEWRSLCAFADGADAAGLPYPGDHHQIKFDPSAGDSAEIMDAFFDKAPWPMPRYHGIAALAQHHGVPTCLVDWSRRAGVASYFAARIATDWARHPHTNTEGAERLSVTAVDLNFLEGCSEFSVIPAARSSNANLHAQHGLFTSNRPSGWDTPKQVCGKAPSFSEPTDFAVFDAALAAGESRPVLRELTLRVTDAPALLALLRELGISAATMFPGFDGVARSIAEIELLREPKAGV